MTLELKHCRPLEDVAAFCIGVLVGGTAAIIGFALYAFLLI